LFTNALRGIKYIKEAPNLAGEEMLKIWDLYMETNHKRIIINIINDIEEFNIFKAKVPNWNKILKI